MLLCGEYCNHGGELNCGWREIGAQGGFKGRQLLGSGVNSVSVCLSVNAGTQTPDPGGSRRLSVHSVLRDREGGLCLRLCDSRPEPAAVGVVWQHAVRPGAPGRRGQAEGAALHVGEHTDR